MPKKNRAKLQSQITETEELKNRLKETEETLRAIRENLVDAFVVHRENGIEVVTTSESQVPYRLMVESMNEGALTLIPDGTIFYCNSRFGQMLQTDCENLVDTSFKTWIVPEEQSRFEAIFHSDLQHGIREEFHLQTAQGNRVPVQISMYALGQGASGGIAILATDISERVQSEEKIRSLAAELTWAEQEERHRISQVLHDDLQQRLFAIKARLAFLRDINLSADSYRDLDEIQASLSESIAISRNLSIDLSPIVLQGEGLADAMTWLSFRMKEQYGLQIEVEAKEDFRQMDQHVRMLLFQSIRELLFNVVKHAGILEAKVILEQENGHGRITVTDDGEGFDTEAVLLDTRSTHGLLLVQDRLNLMGYNMDIRSRPGEGTKIFIEFPTERKPG